MNAWFLLSIVIAIHSCETTTPILQFDGKFIIFRLTPPNDTFLCSSSFISFGVSGMFRSYVFQFSNTFSIDIVDAVCRHIFEAFEMNDRNENKNCKYPPTHSFVLCIDRYGTKKITNKWFESDCQLN